MPETYHAEDLMAQFDARLQAARQNAQQTFSTICGLLQEAGIEVVHIAYDGYGDEGAVESIQARRQGQDFELSEELQEQLTEAAYHLLPCGWPNNDGAFGELVLDVALRKLTRQHNWRFMDSEYDEETIDL